MCLPEEGWNRSSDNSLGKGEGGGGEAGEGWNLSEIRGGEREEEPASGAFDELHSGRDTEGLERERGEREGGRPKHGERERERDREDADEGLEKLPEVH